VLEMYSATKDEMLNVSAIRADVVILLAANELVEIEFALIFPTLRVDAFANKKK